MDTKLLEAGKEALEIWMGRDFDPISKSEEDAYYKLVEHIGYIDDVLEGGTGTPPQISQWTFRGGYVPESLAWSSRLLIANFYRGRYEVEAKAEDWDETIGQEAYVFARLTEPHEVLARIFGRKEYEVWPAYQDIDWLIKPIFTVPAKDIEPLIAAQENLTPAEFASLVESMATHWNEWEAITS